MTRIQLPPLIKLLNFLSYAIADPDSRSVGAGGFSGSYDAVRWYVARWRRERRVDAGDMSKAFIPLLFRPGEANQFDWGHEDVQIAGKPMGVKVAHTRLCWSPAPFVRAYPRETQEMVFDAHVRGFAFRGGVPTRGIYDNMKTTVTSVFTGKERVFNRRFLIMTDHYGVEPVACSPTARWEKGQVENQVGVVRETARVEFKSTRHRTHRRGRPRAWILGVSPPRKRPMYLGSAGFWCAV